MQPTFKSIVPIQIRFSDTDKLGHISNTQYQDYFDLGKVDYFLKVIPGMDFSGLCVVGASVKIDYIRQIFLESQIVIKTRTAAIGNKSMTLEHIIADAVTDEIFSVCSVVLVCFNIKDQTSYPIPEEWKKSIREFEEMS